MNRHDEWRRDRQWRGRDHEHDRDDEQRSSRSSFYPGNPGFEENAGPGRTAGDDNRQPYSQNPYGRYPGQQRRGGDEWYSAPPQRYGQREPYNPRDRYGSDEGRYGSGSRYSESQYGQQPGPDRERQYGERQYGQRQSEQGGRYDSDRGLGRSHRADFDRDPSRLESRFDRGSTYDQGPFADTTDSPRYFGAGNYGDGGASYSGGYDQRQGQRNYGSLYSNQSEQSGQQRRYRSGPKGYTRSDERLREDISERLIMADSIDSSDVSVQVKDAKVTLEGSVPNRRMKHAIEDLADHCPGVQDVDNRIRVKREEWGGNASASSNTMTASGATPTAGTASSGTTFSGKGRKE